jgi:DNA-directed RNA polymerase subunit omega
MARVTIEDCLTQVHNRFLLVHLGAKRVIQLRKGAKPLYEAPKNKEIVLALREIAAGEVTFESIEQIELDELAPGSVVSAESTEKEEGSAQEVQEEISAPEKEDGDTEDTEQKDPSQDQVD